MFYTPGKLDAYVGMSYTSAVDPDKADGVKVSWWLYVCVVPTYGVIVEYSVYDCICSY